MLTSDAEIAMWAMNALADQHEVKATQRDDLERDHEPLSEDACLYPFLAASVMTGPDSHRLARMFGVLPERAAFWAQNLRRAGFWRKRTVLVDHWFDPTTGLFSFLADSLVAQGLVEVVCFDKQGPLYAPTSGRGLFEGN